MELGWLCKTMKECLDQPEIQSSCCAILGELATVSASAKREILLRGGVTAISTALEKYHRMASTNIAKGDSKEVQRNAESALQIICFDEEASDNKNEAS